MNELRVSMVLDLDGRTSRKAANLRNFIRDKLNDPSVSSHGFDCGDVLVQRVLGSLVKTTSLRRGSPEGALSFFDGLNVKSVEMSEGGTDHFPAAGSYDSSTLTAVNVGKASATVRWNLDHRYPLSEDVIEAAVRRASENSSFTDTLRLEVPVVYARSWSLTLMAPNASKALLAYQLLRSGVWQPMFAFADALPDEQKLRLVRQTIEEA